MYQNVLQRVKTFSETIFETIRQQSETFELFCKHSGSTQSFRKTDETAEELSDQLGVLF